jgi:hypothetical protein
MKIPNGGEHRDTRGCGLKSVVRRPRAGDYANSLGTTSFRQSSGRAALAFVSVNAFGTSLANG